MWEKHHRGQCVKRTVRNIRNRKNFKTVKMMFFILFRTKELVP